MRLLPSCDMHGPRFEWDLWWLLTDDCISTWLMTTSNEKERMPILCFTWQGTRAYRLKKALLNCIFYCFSNLKERMYLPRFTINVFLSTKPSTWSISITDNREATETHIKRLLEASVVDRAISAWEILCRHHCASPNSPSGSCSCCKRFADCLQEAEDS